MFYSIVVMMSVMMMMILFDVRSDAAFTCCAAAFLLRCIFAPFAVLLFTFYRACCSVDVVFFWYSDGDTYIVIVFCDRYVVLFRYLPFAVMIVMLFIVCVFNMCNSNERRRKPYIYFTMYVCV